jgi:hypothetical protein
MMMDQSHGCRMFTQLVDSTALARKRGREHAHAFSQRARDRNSDAAK